MKKILALLLIVSFVSAVVSSCSRSVTPYEAANHHYSHCRDMR
ncbi:MAG: hypothetical protein P4L51_26110 [Puia sp.]|nr:hypothetical protein [Puia sp.]